MTWAAAVVSIVGAVIAILSAVIAALQARGAITLNHKVAALDRQSEQIREDYRDLMKAIGNNTESPLVRFSSIYAAGEVLRAHPQTSDILSSSIEHLTAEYHAAVTRQNKPTPYVADNIESLRTGFRESLAEIERLRSVLLG